MALVESYEYKLHKDEDKQGLAQAPPVAKA
jgi:hypothetical protein